MSKRKRTKGKGLQGFGFVPNNPARQPRKPDVRYALGLAHTELAAERDNDAHGEPGEDECLRH